MSAISAISATHSHSPAPAHSAHSTPAAAARKLLKLSELAVGASAVVREMPKTGGAASLRLRELGVLPGVRILLARTAPLGDPVAIKVRGSVLTLRKSEAAHVLVEALRVEAMRVEAAT